MAYIIIIAGKMCKSQFLRSINFYSTAISVNIMSANLSQFTNCKTQKFVQLIKMCKLTHPN